MKADQRLIDSFRESCQAIQPYIADALIAELDGRAQNSTSRWQKLVAKAGQKIDDLEGELEERKVFWQDFKSAELWLKDASWKSGAAREMYTEGMEKTKQELEVCNKISNNNNYNFILL